MTTMLFFGNLYCNHTVEFNCYSHAVLVNLLSATLLSSQSCKWLLKEIGLL